MLKWWSSTAWYRNYLLRKSKNEVLTAYLKTPLPDPGLPVMGAEYLALDFETTGLNPEKDAILSAGYTTIRNGRVILRESGHFLVRVDVPLPASSVVIHQITDDAMKQGVPLSEVVEHLLEHMQGKVLLVHYAAIERGFLNTACRKLYGIRPPMRIVDTLEIEKRLIVRRQQGIAKGQLRLFNLRRQYNLPRYRAHNAMEDALSTAELFLAQISLRQSDKHRLVLRDIL
jgi:DNA polymerase-3 subunit epsilon